MSAIRKLFRGLSLLWLIGVIVIGVGGTWLQRNPEAMIGLAGGAISVDHNASVATQAEQMAAGYAFTRNALEESERAAAPPKTVAEEWERQRREEEALDDVRAAIEY